MTTARRSPTCGARNNSYFPMMGTPMLRGRNFNNTDVANGPLVAIITSQLAHDLYGDKDPVGQLISSSSMASLLRRPGEPSSASSETRARAAAPRSRRAKCTCRARSGRATTTMAFLVRGAVPVTTLLPAIRRAVAGVDPTARAFRAAHHDGRGVRQASGASAIHDVATRAAWRTGLALSIVGVYGVIAYFVLSVRTNSACESHSAAPRPALQWMVVKEGIVLGVFGVAVGTVAAYRNDEVPRAPGVRNHRTRSDDIRSGGGRPDLVAGVASYLPAIKATEVDPVEAIRA